MALARRSLPARRHSSNLIDVLKGATTASPNTPRRFEPSAQSTRNTETTTPGQAQNSSPTGNPLWGFMLNQLEEAAKTARSQVLDRSNDPPEVAWKRRSDQVNIELRDSGRENYGPRSSTTYQARKIRGAAAGDTVGLNEAEVPMVASGRTVTSGDFGRAVIRLNQILQRNRVKQEWRRDKYFTRPTQLRYELRSRRHRQRFAATIRRKVQIVQAIQRRGM